MYKFQGAETKWLPKMLFEGVRDEDDPDTAGVKAAVKWQFARLARTYDNGAFIYLSDEDIAKADAFAEAVIEQKNKEDAHQRDHSHEHKRWRDGILGEMAVAYALDLPEDTVEFDVGDSKAYNHPDLRKAGYNVGVKTCSPDNYPLVNRNILQPQIFVLVNVESRCAFVIGLGSARAINDLTTQNREECDSHVRCPSVLYKKTAFPYLFKLSKCNSLDDLEPYRVKEIEKSVVVPFASKAKEQKHNIDEALEM